MFQHYLIAAWRSARRDRFYALLNVFGLALGFAAVILIGLFVRDELTYDHFLPGYQEVYRVQLTPRRGGAAADDFDQYAGPDGSPDETRFPGDPRQPPGPRIRPSGCVTVNRSDRDDRIGRSGFLQGARISADQRRSGDGLGTT
ncbi:MAG: ABC transporter permease [Aliidongia sp.]